MHPLIRLRNKCYLGILLAGGIAGVCEQTWRHQDAPYNFFLGLILVCITGFLGGFAGFFIKNLARCITRRGVYTGQSGDGVLMGSLLGTVIGTLVAAIACNGMPTAMGASVGAAIGAFLGALPDEFVGPILELLHDREQEPTLPDQPKPYDI